MTKIILPAQRVFVRRWSGVSIHLGKKLALCCFFELDHAYGFWSFRIAFYVGPIHYEVHRWKDRGTQVVLEYGA